MVECLPSMPDHPNGIKVQMVAYLYNLALGNVKEGES